MLYQTEAPSIEILTHPYTPLTETNGFKQLGDFTVVDAVARPDLSDLSGLGSWFSKHVVGTVKQAIRKPIPALAKLSGKVALGGITLITETGVLGKDAKRIGKKAEVVAASASAGAATGFVTSGFNPLGLIAGAGAGAVKGLDEASKTSKPGDIGKAFYQSAAWGGAAGVVVGAGSMVANAKAAEAAKAANVANFAAESGYGTPAVVNSAGYLATTAKVAKDLGMSALLAKGLIPSPGQQPPVGETGDGGYQPPNINLTVPGSDGSGGGAGAAGSGSVYSGGSLMPSGADATVPPYQEASVIPGGMSTTTKVVIGAALVVGAELLSRRAVKSASKRRRKA